MCVGKVAQGVRGATPLACCVVLTVVWSGAPTGSLWEVSYIGPSSFLAAARGQEGEE